MLVVTCVYKADYINVMNFCNENNLDLLVYNKNDNLKKGEEIVRIRTAAFTLIDIPNFGRCDYGFLYYIWKNYDNLPDRVFFTKANYMDQQIQIERCLDMSYEFMHIGKHVKFGVFDDTNQTIQYLMSCGVLRNDIETFFETKETSDEFDGTFCSYLTRDFYRMVYGNYDRIPKHPIVQFGHGPCFYVSKQLIRGHAIEIYERLLDTFYPNKNHWTTWENHSEEETYNHLGIRVHNNLVRFWSTLFIQNYQDYQLRTDYQNFVGYVPLK